MIIPTALFILGMFGLVLIESYWTEKAIAKRQSFKIRSLDAKKSYIDMEDNDIENVS